MIFNIPWWIFIIFLFICFSGYMALKSMQAERKIEQQFIEREGQKYIDRMNQEKEQRYERSN